MALPVPAAAKRSEAYAPLLALLRDHLIKPKDLAARWGFTSDHLANMRRAGYGVPFVRLPTGRKEAVRYRLSDIISAELTGTAGAVTLERVCIVIAAAEEISEEQRKLIIARLRNALG